MVRVIFQDDHRVIWRRDDGHTAGNGEKSVSTANITFIGRDCPWDVPIDAPTAAVAFPCSYVVIVLYWFWWLCGISAIFQCPPQSSLLSPLDRFVTNPDFKSSCPCDLRSVPRFVSLLVCGSLVYRKSFNSPVILFPYGHYHEISFIESFEHRTTFIRIIFHRYSLVPFVGKPSLNVM